MLFSGDRLDAASQPYKTVNCDQFPGAHNFILELDNVVQREGLFANNLDSAEFLI
jgi:hypothetical protein